MNSYRLSRPSDGTDFGIWPGSDPEGALIRLAEHHGDLDDDGIIAEEVDPSAPLPPPPAIPREGRAVMSTWRPPSR